MPEYYIVLSALENEHAQSFDEAFYFPGAIVGAGMLREESIPILIELGVIAPCLAPHDDPDIPE